MEAYVTRDADDRSLHVWIGERPVCVSGEFYAKTKDGRFMRIMDKKVAEDIQAECGARMEEGEMWECELVVKRVVPKGEYA